MKCCGEPFGRSAFALFGSTGSTDITRATKSALVPLGDWPFLPSVRCKACFRRKGLAARGRSAQTARNLLINRLDSTQIFQQQVLCHGLLADVAITGWWFLRQHWARSVSYSCWDASCLTRGTVLRRRIVQHSKLMVGSAVTLLTKILLEWLRSERLWSSCG